MGGMLANVCSVPHTRPDPGPWYNSVTDISGPSPMSRRNVTRGREGRGMTVTGYGAGSARRKQRGERLRVGMACLSPKRPYNRTALNDRIWYLFDRAPLCGQQRHKGRPLPPL